MSSFHTGNDFAARSPDSTGPNNTPSACPACQSRSISTTAKSPDANSYWRCEACGEVWNVGRRRGVRTGANRWW